MEKKSFFENKKLLFILAGVIVLAAVLRVIGLNKPEGLWYDEAVSFFGARNSFPFGIIGYSLTADLQPPLYILILHIWMAIFGTADIALRALSALFGVLIVPVMYLAGKELSNKKTGLIAALLTALNALLIYYSQEVRIYSLVVLLASLSVLFLIKVNNDPTLSKKILPLS
jgi:predicted membrane-bound mannosyltransferase